MSTVSGRMWVKQQHINYYIVLHLKCTLFSVSVCICVVLFKATPLNNDECIAYTNVMIILLSYNKTYNFINNNQRWASKLRDHGTTSIISGRFFFCFLLFEIVESTFFANKEQKKTHDLTATIAKWAKCILIFFSFLHCRRRCCRHRF